MENITGATVRRPARVLVTSCAARPTGVIGPRNPVMADFYAQVTGGVRLHEVDPAPALCVDAGSVRSGSPPI